LAASVDGSTVKYPVKGRRKAAFLWRSGMADEQIAHPIPKWQRFLRENLSSLIIPMPTGGKTTLTEYIEENSKLLSALGVFLGLSVFANNLVDKGVANNLADKGIARLLSFYSLLSASWSSLN
jgi:hypothetical protein